MFRLKVCFLCSRPAEPDTTTWQKSAVKTFHRDSGCPSTCMMTSSLSLKMETAGLKSDPLHLKIYFSSCSYSFEPHCTEWSTVCSEFDTRWMFSHSSAESGKFLCAHWNAILRGGPTSMICDITNSPKFNCVMGKLKVSQAHTLRVLSSSSI